LYNEITISVLERFLTIVHMQTLSDALPTLCEKSVFFIAASGHM